MIKDDPSIAVIIVNYRTSELAINCVKSVWPEISARAKARIFMVENGSGDSSKERIGQAIKDNGWTNKVTILAEDRNLGFSKGNNLAIRHILKNSLAPEYFWFLNPDTLIKPGALNALVAHMNAYPSTGIAGSRLESPNGAVQASAHNFHSPIGEMWEAGLYLLPMRKLLYKYIVSPPALNESHECGWLCGANIFVRSDLFGAIGLFDEEYFLYYEDVDLCLRAKRAGWGVWYVPPARAIHLCGMSTLHTKRNNRPTYWYHSRRRYFLKFYGLTGLISADIMRSLGILGVFSVCVFNMVKKTAVGIFGLLWCDMKGLLAGDAWKARRGGEKNTAAIKKGDGDESN